MIKKFGVSVCPNTEHFLDYISTWYKFSYLEYINGKFYESNPPPPSINNKIINDKEIQTSAEILFEVGCKICDTLHRGGLIYNCIYEHNHIVKNNRIEHGICRFVPKIGELDEAYILNQLFFFSLKFSDSSYQNQNTTPGPWKISFGEHKFPPLVLKINSINRGNLLMDYRIPEDIYDLEISPCLYDIFSFHLEDNNIYRRLSLKIKKWKEGIEKIEKYIRPKKCFVPY